MPLVICRFISNLVLAWPSLYNQLCPFFQQISCFSHIVHDYIHCILRVFKVWMKIFSLGTHMWSEHIHVERVNFAICLSKNFFRAVTENLYLKGKSGKEISDEFDGCLSLECTFIYKGQIMGGKTQASLLGEPRRHVEMTNDTSSETLRRLVLKDRQMKARDNSEGSVHTSLHEHMGLSDWSPKSLTDDQKIVHASMLLITKPRLFWLSEAFFIYLF